jgi:putative tryptophan/tyrosine transport system substrate-binding protein
LNEANATSSPCSAAVQRRWPLHARAQQGERMRRIGVLNAFAEADAEVQANLAAFRQALEKLGWIDGRNLRIDYRAVRGSTAS